MNFVIFVPPRKHMQGRELMAGRPLNGSPQRLWMGPDVLRGVGVVEFFGRLLNGEVGGAVVFLCPLTS